MKKSEIERLIKGQFLCRIVFRGEEYPYIAPFQYVFVNGTLYFHFTAYGRKMKLIGKEEKVCVEIEQYNPRMSRYMFVTLQGSLKIVTDPVERAEAVKKMREFGKEKLSRNFLAAHGLKADKNWDAFTAEKPFVIVKLDPLIAESGLKSPELTRSASSHRKGNNLKASVSD
jgi:nitroimidazol reductase NimA-like FMN-containing flavoprotein (pyridoxamine 5'-phosphate oxidase superfamily)